MHIAVSVVTLRAARIRDERIRREKSSQDRILHAPIHVDELEVVEHRVARITPTRHACDLDHFVASWRPSPVRAAALGALADSPGTQEELVRPRGSRLRELLRDGLRQARVAAGADAVCTVMEVAPWSRIPEARALLVPRDD